MTLIIKATLEYTTFNTPNLANYSPYELVFSRKPKSLLHLLIKDYNISKLLQDFRSKRLVMINKDINFFQYNSRDLVFKVVDFLWNRTVDSLKTSFHLLL